MEYYSLPERMTKNETNPACLSILLVGALLVSNVLKTKAITYSSSWKLLVNLQVRAGKMRSTKRVLRYDKEMCAYCERMPASD